MQMLKLLKFLLIKSGKMSGGIWWRGTYYLTI